MDDPQSETVAVCRIALISGVLSIHVWICLATTDYLLALGSPGYPASRGYLMPAVIFFTGICLGTYVTYRQKWSAQVTLLFVPIALFFPMVFFTVSLELRLLRDSEAFPLFTSQYCGTATLSSCGPGFANLVLLRSLRAMAAVLTVPPLCYIMHVHWMKTGLLIPSTSAAPPKTEPVVTGNPTAQVAQRMLNGVIDARLKDGLLHWNLLVLSVVALHTALLNVKAGFIYACLGTLVLGASIWLKQFAIGKSPGTKTRCVNAGMLTAELVLIAGVIVGVRSVPGADAPTASLIVIMISFLTMPLSANRLSVFLVSRAVLFSTCVTMILLNPTSSQMGSTGFMEHIAPLTILTLINIVVGALIYRNSVGQVQLQLSVEVLQKETAGQNRELEQVLKTLSQEEQKNRAQYQFREKLFRFMGHDLRQPINALSFLLFKLQKEESDPARLKSLALARESIGSTNRMIEDVLDLSTERHREQNVNLENVSVQYLFNVLQNEFEQRFQSAGVDFRVVKTSAEIHSDKEHVLRALRNLLSNVRKYAPTGNCVLGVRRRPGYFDLQVTDQGAGIAKADQEKIFEPFERAGQSQFESGYGLGLAIAKELVIAGHGQILVSSRPGKGTIFTLRFPRPARLS